MRMSYLRWEIFRNPGEIPQRITEFLSRSKHGSLFQSSEWVDCFIKNRSKYLILAAFMNDKPVFGALVLKSSIPGTKYFVGRVSRGPVFDDIDTAMNLWEEYERKLCSEGMIGLIVNPYWERHENASLEEHLAARGYRPAREIPDHCETLTIDLFRSEEEIFSGFVDAKRRNIRKGLRMGIRAQHVADSREMKLFWKMHNEMCRKKGIRGPSMEEFERIRSFANLNPSYCACILAWLEDTIIGGWIVLRHGTRVVYTWGSATTSQMKGIPKTELAVWKSILWAKETGASIFDLGGITPNAEKGSAALGINRFKRGFSHNEVSLFQPMQRVFHPALLRIHRSLQKTKRYLTR